MAAFSTNAKKNSISILTPSLRTPLGNAVVEECELGREGFTISNSGHHILTTSFSGMMRVKLWGAGGGGSGYTKGGYGSAGGYTEGIISFTAGDTFTIVVGQGGMGGGYSIVSSQQPSFPDGSIAGSYDGWQVGGCGGGSSRIAKGEIKKELLNDPGVEYLLIAGGGGGGADYILSEQNNTGVSSSQGLEECGEGGGLTGGSGSLFYQQNSGGETKSSPGGGGTQIGGGVPGSAGRQPNGTSGSKYQAGLSTGGGSGGGYYGGGGSAGYYSQGGGGSGYIAPSVTLQARSIRGGTGIPAMKLPHYASFPEGKPTSKTGCGGAPHPSDLQELQGGDGAITLALVSSQDLLGEIVHKPDGSKRTFQLSFGIQTITVPISVSLEFLKQRLGVVTLPSTILVLPHGEEFDLSCETSCRLLLTDQFATLKGDLYPLAPPYLHIYHKWTSGEIACAQKDQEQTQTYLNLLGIQTTAQKAPEYARFPIPVSHLAIDLLSLLAPHYHISNTYPSGAWYVWLQKKDQK